MGAGLCLDGRMFRYPWGRDVMEVVEEGWKNWGRLTAIFLLSV